MAKAFPADIRLGLVNAGERPFAMIPTEAELYSRL